MAPERNSKRDKSFKYLLTALETQPLISESANLELWVDWDKMLCRCEMGEDVDYYNNNCQLVTLTFSG